MFGSAVTTAADGNKLAAILFPSTMEYRYSASKVRVMNNSLAMTKNCAFIKPPTWDELLDTVIRAHMVRNKRIIDKLPYDQILETIKAWMIDAILHHDVKWLRIGYGGDPYYFRHPGPNVSLLADINNIVKGMADEDIRVIIRTASMEYADVELSELQRKKELDPRLIVVAEPQAYGDMPLFIDDRVHYYWERSAPGDAVEDIKSVPLDSDGTGFFRKEVAISIPHAAYKFFAKQ